MGMFSVTISVGSMEGDDFRRVDAVVDTGANYSQFPAPLLNELKVQPYAQEPFELADGSSKTYPVGIARLRIGDKEAPCHVVFGEGSDALLGSLALEVFRLMVDPTTQELRPAKQWRRNF